MRVATGLLAVAIGWVLASVTGVEAKGGSDLSVSTTAGVTGTVVQGIVTIANASTKTLTVTSAVLALEVRYPNGSTAVVATRPLAAPPTIPAVGTIQVPYAVDLCGGQIASYVGAKDMRSLATVVAGSQTGKARSANFVPPSASACPVCGNRIREANEQCDGGSCCTPTCTFAADGGSCTDGNACTTTDTCQGGTCRGADPIRCVAFGQCYDPGVCNPLTGTCTNPLRLNGSSCDDGSACSLNDVCLSGRCAGTPIRCDDGNVCTTDACAAGTCQYLPNAEPCDDGDPCSEGDTCAEGICASGGGAPGCTDHRACTDDACEAGVGCTNVPAAVCEGCVADECLLCRGDCVLAGQECEAGCWAGFLGCLNGCTSTYCAPFCQVDLGRCLEACPLEGPCFQSCDAGNGCAVDCSE